MHLPSLAAKRARNLTDRLDGFILMGFKVELEERLLKKVTLELKDRVLDAAEVVVARQGIANLTLDAVAAEAGLSKGGLLHHFPNKDLLIESLVVRSAENWKNCYLEAYEKTSEGPGRMARALLSHCLSDTQCWTDQLRRSSAAVFAALAQNPSLIKPMRDAYSELQNRVSNDGLPPGVGEAIAAAMDGLWLYWVLGLVPVNQDFAAKVRNALEEMIVHSMSVGSTK